MIDLDKTINWAKDLHSNQKYGEHPYTLHLQMVVNVGLRYIDLTKIDKSSIISMLWLHDSLEDCNITYNDLVNNTNNLVADIVYNVTNELGKNRQERNFRTYIKIRSNPISVFVKLCDRIANTLHSISIGNKYDVYKEEYSTFKKSLYKDGEYDEMWKELDMLNNYFELLKG